MTDLNKLKKLAYKKAKGYTVKEVTEEYSVNADGEMTLVKRRVSTKPIPPDLAALRYLLDNENASDNYSSMTDQQLQDEKTRLLNLLMENTD